MMRFSLVLVLLAVASTNAFWSSCSKLKPNMWEKFKMIKVTKKCIAREVSETVSNTAINIFTQLVAGGSMYENDLFSDMPTGFEDTTPIEAILNPAQFLENMNLIDNARALRGCIAANLDQVHFTDEAMMNVEFDNEKFQQELLDRVDGTSAEENVQLGVDNCGVVEDYDVYKYMQCISSYCETGEAPSE